jgi:hypothetical protein
MNSPANHASAPAARPDERSESEAKLTECSFVDRTTKHHAMSVVMPAIPEDQRRPARASAASRHKQFVDHVVQQFSSGQRFLDDLACWRPLARHHLANLQSRPRCYGRYMRPRNIGPALLVLSTAACGGKAEGGGVPIGPDNPSAANASESGSPESGAPAAGGSLWGQQGGPTPHGCLWANGGTCVGDGLACPGQMTPHFDCGEGMYCCIDAH